MNSDDYDEEAYFIKDGAALENYTAIPNIIDDMRLSAYAVRLYLRIKRRVRQLGNGKTWGVAYDSVKTLARDCGMSAPTVTRAKRELVAAGLIRIQKVPREHGEFPSDHISIVDIWPANSIYYSDSLAFKNSEGEDCTGAEARRIIASDPETKELIIGFIENIMEEISKSDR